VSFVVGTQLTDSYVEDPSNVASSNLADDPVVPGSAPPPTNALVAIVEMGMGGISTDDRVRIGLVSVIPPTGEVVWDEFDGKLHALDKLLLICRFAGPIRVGNAIDTFVTCGAITSDERAE